MPIDLIHRIGIAASAEKIYRALTTDDGIKAWWRPDVNLDAHAGGKVVFGFFDHSSVFELRISASKPPSLARWQFVEGSSPDWAGTTQEFILEPNGDEVLLKFCHGGWERGGYRCYDCNTTWGHLLVCLKDYAECGMKNLCFK